MRFFDFYVIPLAEKLSECRVFGMTSDETLTLTHENRREWEWKGRDVVAMLVDKYCRDVPEEERSEQIFSSNIYKTSHVGFGIMV
jgi:hypothetical protein